MKVAFIDRSGANSIWSVLYPIATKLALTGHDVTILKVDDGKQRETLPVPEGTTEVRIPVPAANSLLLLIYQQVYLFFCLINIARSNSFDIVHANFINPAWLVRIVFSLYKAKIVNTRHELSGSMSRHWRIADRLTERLIDSQVYISLTVANSFSPQSGNKFNCTIKNGIDVRAFDRDLKNSADCRKSTVITVGRFVKVKGHSILINAWANVVEKHPDARLVLVGDGPERHTLERLCAEQDILSSVEFLGWMSKQDAHLMIKQARMMVVPSDGSQEGFGLVVAEAMALRTPLVCSDIPVFKEVASDTADYFPAGDVVALSKAINSMLDDKDKMAEMTNKAASRVAEYFDQCLMAEAYIKLYRKLI
ncbi:glycosyltransferase family 4 protein [Cobetia amphilecti]|uniref:glycosyltransferase family 4 protein n=1 Tax=Cobetia amphilecti TaxID=1055104 RepID=UPI002549E75E|nr:glycosyltransferase family 4 protein [Cobetia amphilecti]